MSRNNCALARGGLGPGEPGNEVDVFGSYSVGLVCHYNNNTIRGIALLIIIINNDYYKGPAILQRRLIT